MTFSCCVVLLAFAWLASNAATAQWLGRAEVKPHRLSHKPVQRCDSCTLAKLLRRTSEPISRTWMPVFVVSLALDCKDSTLITRCAWHFVARLSAALPTRTWIWHLFLCAGVRKSEERQTRSTVARSFAGEARSTACAESTDDTHSNPRSEQQTGVRQVEACRRRCHEGLRRRQSESAVACRPSTVWQVINAACFQGRNLCWLLLSCLLCR